MTPESQDPAARSRVEHLVDLTEPPASEKPTSHESRPDRPAERHRYFAHRYDVHGVVRIGSEVPLRELEYFRAPRLQSGYDVTVRVRVDTKRPRRRALVTQTTSPLGVRYQEHLGGLGADVRVDMGSPMEVGVGPLLARSPHVAYTNVVEPLLRFLLVSKGYVLLHAACLDMGGRGVLLSARTDTGKTGTVLRLLREGNATFLADDMTVLTPDGTALCYPKPLTISDHTLRAVNIHELNRREQLRLRLQSRLHSKQGRAVGARLGERSLPIMALNAATQWLVPPPKYAVDRLVPCRISTSVPCEELFVIEHGPATLTDIVPTNLIDRLVANTDDAYGFPPFGYLAPALVIGEDGYEQLRAKERSLLEAAMARVRGRLLASEDYGWAQRIPKLVARGGREGLRTVSSRAETAKPGLRLRP